MVHSSDGYGRNVKVNDKVKDLTPEELGIFPKSELKFHYRHFTTILNKGNPYSEHYGQLEELELLCPQHAPEPKHTNKSWGSNAEDRYKMGTI